MCSMDCDCSKCLVSFLYFLHKSCKFIYNVNFKHYNFNFFICIFFLFWVFLEGVCEVLMKFDIDYDKPRLNTNSVLTPFSLIR